MEKVVLSGVPTEASEPSGLDMDKFRCFKLRDDLFFRMPRAEVLPPLGEPGTRPTSWDMPWLRAGVAGETVAIVSAGLGRFDCGEGTARFVVWRDAGRRGGSLNVESKLA